jgi:mannose/fructose/N-acetylgalactosamine-specific phosphotransferase system component IIC
MAEMVTIDGQQYKKRHPLAVLGLSFLTLGVYFFVWYYKINDELRRAEKDEGISPLRSLMAMIFGWLIIVPPFIAMYNTAKHVQAFETRRGVGQTVEPSLTIALMLLVSFANGVYVQEHLNRAWGATAAPVKVPDPGLVPTG